MALFLLFSSHDKIETRFSDFSLKKDTPLLKLSNLLKYLWTFSSLCLLMQKNYHESWCLNCFWSKGPLWKIDNSKKDVCTCWETVFQETKKVPQRMKNTFITCSNFWPWPFIFCNYFKDVCTFSVLENNLREFITCEILIFSITELNSRKFFTSGAQLFEGQQGRLSVQSSQF